MSNGSVQPKGRRRLLGVIGILVGVLLGVAFVYWRRDGDVAWQYLLIVSGIPIGGGLVALWLSRK